MWKKDTAELNCLPSSPDEQQAAPARRAERVKDLLTNHKGKLAVGAAAMLGIAIFYKWRESQLSRDEPAEYARLQRLKHAVGAGEDEECGIPQGKRQGKT